MWMWFCVLVGTAILCGLGWAAMKGYGLWAMRRDEIEREQLAVEWKRRAAERKAKAEGTAAPGGPTAPEETGENPPLY